MVAKLIQFETGSATIKQVSYKELDEIVAIMVVAGLMLRLPSNWRVAADGQYAHNTARYRGLGGADPARWQALVDQGAYNPLRDTQVFAPPDAFYDRVLIYRGGYGRFVTVGDYDTIDAALRVSNRSINLPTGSGALNVGGDYRRTHLADYVDERRYLDGSLASTPERWQGPSARWPRTRCRASCRHGSCAPR